MKKTIVGVVVLGCAGLWSTGAQAQSCNGMSGTMSQDKSFVMQASVGDYTEITFSQLALQKSSNPKVKAFAQKMVTDHNQLEAEMKPFADKLGVTPATSLDAQHQQLYDQLNQLSGADFDKQYMSDMDTDHHKTLDAFKQEESTTQDKQLKATVKKGERVVAQHTDMADKMSKMMGGTASGM